MKGGLLSCPRFLSLPSSTMVSHKLKHKSIFSTINGKASIDERPLKGRERRQLRNERRESNAYNWREEVEEKLIEKPKKRYTSWTEELNLDNLASLGPRWWIVKVAKVGQETAELLARSLIRNFPNVDFKVYIPSVQIKRKLKNGTVSVKPKLLFPGSVFLKCVMNKEVHDYVRECYGVRSFVGSTVGNRKRQINRPKPVDEEEMEEIFKQAKVEQEMADRAFEEEQEKVVESPSAVSKESETASKRRGRSRKVAQVALKGKDNSSLVPGLTVQVSSGAFAGFSGILKKLDHKRGLATIGFTLFGKETLADIDASEILTETS